ncbi:MAG: hypothetical protein JEZ08_08775 [Clostridiales bacterium]|nr:hypothetical protein [Clostridiales bacterium]
MKKLWIVLIVSLMLTGCSMKSIANDITYDKFEDKSELKEFSMKAYIETIDPVISSKDYIRLDSIFLEEDSNEVVVITDQVVNNILNIYQSYEENRSTYAVINFLDLHIKRLSSLDIDILIYKLIYKVETDYIELKNLVTEAQFLYITKDYVNRLTNTYLDNYEVTQEALALYPEIEDYIEKLYLIISGGYQIRKFEDRYYIFPDYASFLVRYDDYYSEATKDITDILVSKSRNIVKTEDMILMDIEEIAYQINQIEDYLKKYPDSVYYDMLRETYRDYFITMITNEDNIEILTSRVTLYKYDTLSDFRKIRDRYSYTQMSRLLDQMVTAIDENAGQYNEAIIEDIITKINTSY